MLHVEDIVCSRGALESGQDDANNKYSTVRITLHDRCSVFLFCLFLYIYAKCVGGNVVDADICIIFVYDSTVF